MDGYINSKNLGLEQIANSGQCFRWQPYAGGYQIPVGARSFFIEPVGEGTFHVQGDVTLGKVIDYFDLMTDYQSIIDRIPEDDTYLKAAANMFSGVRILRQEFDEVVISFMISQNNSIQRIKHTLSKLVAINGGAMPTVADLRSFTEADFRAAGAGYRTKYLQLLDASWLGMVHKYSVLDVKRDLVQSELQLMPGIGPKVMNCIELYGVHRLDACPIDRWIKRIFQEHYNGEPSWICSPYAGVYQQYVFCYERAMAHKLDTASMVESA